MNQETLPRVIGIGGFKRSGKDTLARALRKLSGYDVIGMSDAIVAEVEQLTGWEITDEMKEQVIPGQPGVTFRDVLIQHGERRRAMLPSYWTDEMAQQVHASLLAGKGVIVAGLRMEEEFQWIRRNGGRVIWLTRHGIVSNGHATEADQSHLCDLPVANDGDIEQVASKAFDGLAALSTHSH